MIIHSKSLTSNSKKSVIAHDNANFAYQLSCIESSRLHVVVCENQTMLNQLQSELVFFGAAPYVFADWETLIYDRLPISDEIVSRRIGLLSDMPSSGILLISLSSLMQRLAPPSYLLGRYFDIKVGHRFVREDHRQRLAKAGYTQVDVVYGAGEFAIRGGVVDIFAMGQALPFRLELFDDEVESIRFFDPSTQRTISDETLVKMRNEQGADVLYPQQASTDSFSILPAYEFAFDDKEMFRQNFAQYFEGISHRKVDFYQEVMAGILPSGIHYYQPLFFEKRSWQQGVFFNYLKKDNANSDPIFVLPERLSAITDHLWQGINERYHNYRHDQAYPILSPELLFLPKNDFFYHLNQFDKISFEQINPDAQVLALPSLTINHKAGEPMGALLDFIKNTNEPILLGADSAGREQILLELLQSKANVELVRDFGEFCACIGGISTNGDAVKNTNKSHLPKVYLTIAPIERSLYLKDKFVLISESLLFGRATGAAGHKKVHNLSADFLTKSVAELNVGNLVVHIEYGIGRYMGLELLDVGEGEQEFIHIKYADDASVYVPVVNIGLIGRYSGTDSELVPLSKLGSGRWDKARQKALTQIYDVAAELLNIQARRNAKEGISFGVDMRQYELFASGFEFDETDDQQAAITAVMNDMKQSRPMDRLICGDVGFGKTEVAMRAAFIAVQAGYQVAVLTPTTLLAGQHEDSFRNRFANWAITIEGLSRFNKARSQQILTNLAQGKVDIIIGTHRLLQDDVKFAKLGLMIVDEEHRFGVRHKERIKAIQSDVDSLSMTATPIPRTLNMALSGMQDISIIATPPARRLAIKTFVLEKNEQTTKDAILREILRGGQVYYLHNDVASIELAATNLVNLIPEVRVGVAHGQMNERELGMVMSNFYHKKTNVLVASTIIETGIDVPNANTIIINRADKFGLAQLHQLRGRVGRSHHQAYCYLFVPSIKALSSDAKKRLDAVSQANTLGAGFMLASEDLQMRGAGEILGSEQSGNMQTIGFGLYMDMLTRATKAIKAGKTPTLDTSLDLVSDINLHTSAIIPSDYLSDVSERLILYKRIGAASDMSELTDIRTEMMDRFGSFPAPIVSLFLVHKIRILASAIGVVKADISAHQLTLEFANDTPVDGMAIIKLLQSDEQYRMNNATTLSYRFKQEKQVNERAEAVFALFAYLKNNLVNEPSKDIPNHY